ncbi:hypothetical protein [Marilutibacter chinensis]|uniref:Uncharacterized protein n=1 Tax=Marilutibacter chinensis TaxID=2912247 RepID=A0ABS9HYE3_9GAMM|nr:hypothetical protein [Lysobacter chinensis]MCF7223571.1 hypothetical protein [Lysobacter chinensis]
MSIYEDLLFLHGHLGDLRGVGDPASHAVPDIAGVPAPATSPAAPRSPARTAPARADRPMPGFRFGCCG